MQTMIQGSSAHHTWLVLGVAPTAFGGGAVPAESSRERSAGESHSSFGRHTFRKRIRQAIETSDAPMSTIHGLMKLEIRYCGIANDTPVTTIAGQTSFIPFQPANAQISQNGTMSEKNGSCRPTIAPSRNGSMPVTPARPPHVVPSATQST